MIDWQPISTVPLDRPALVTDGKVWGVAKRWTYTEPAEIGYNNSPMFGGDTRRPNPKAGEITHYWAPTAGWCIWDEETEWETGEYEQRSPDGCVQATHWAEIPAPPQSSTQSEKP